MYPISQWVPQDPQNPQQFNFSQPHYPGKICIQQSFQPPSFQPHLFQPPSFQPHLFQPHLFQPHLFQPQPQQTQQLYRVPSPLFIASQIESNERSQSLSPIELKNIDELKKEKLKYQQLYIQQLEAKKLENEQKLKSFEEKTVKVETIKEEIEKKEKSKLFTQFVMLLWLGSIKGYKKSYVFLYWIYKTHIDDIHDDSLKYISEYYYLNKIFPPGLVYHPVFPSFNILEPIKEMSIEEEKQHDAIIRDILQNIISNPEKNSMQSHIVAENLIYMFL